MRRMTTPIDCDELVTAVHDLRALSPTLSRLIELTTSPSPDLGAITSCINYDQALTARALRLANSAAYGARREILTARDAVVRLGSSSVMRLALDVELQGHVRVAIPEYGLREGELWRSSVTAALAVECMASVTQTLIPPAAVTAALLQDIGKLVLSRFLAPDALDLLRRAESDSGISATCAEQKLLGMDHCDVGALIAQHWDLPPPIVRGILYHHNPTAVDDTVCYVAYLSHAVAGSIHDGDLGDVDPAQLMQSCQHMSIDENGLEQLSSLTARRYELLASEY